MYARLHNQFGTAGMILSVVAIVLALAGGALAAGAGKPGPRGKPGKTGKTGPAGPAGAPGAAGKEGPEGLQGKEGKEGKQGKEGSPWTAGGTLPSGATEKGEWSLVGNAYGQGELEFKEGEAHLSEEVILKQTGGGFRHIANSASFNIPLAEVPVAHYLRTTGQEPFLEGSEEKERAQPECPGTAAEPKAKPGNLCVYASFEENAEKIVGPFILPRICSFGTGGDCLGGGSGADKFGFGLVTVSHEEGVVNVAGSWAVTGK